MNPLFVCEILVGIVLQVLMVVLAAFVIERSLEHPKSICHLWTACFLSILGLVGAAMLLPHFRPDTVWLNASGDTLMAVVTWETAIGKAIVIAWSIGILLIAVLRIIRYFLLVRFLTTRCEPIATEVVDLVVRSRAELPDRLQLLVSDDIQGPFCWQLHRPTIVLPRYLLAEGGHALRHVLLHELEHLRTNHPVQLFLQRLCTTILWFHPAVWWAGRRAELAREFHCDEVAVRDDGMVSAYLRTLIAIAERGLESPSCVLAFGRRRSAIAKRTEKLVRLAEMQTRFSGRRQSLSLAGLLLVALIATQAWLPVNVLASSRSRWSPWPKWSARVLHDFGISARDFEPFDERFALHDLLRADH